MRIATFNAENLFSRVRALNLASSAAISAVLRKIDDFQALLARTSYTAADKARLLELHDQLKPYLLVNVERGRLWRTRRNALMRRSKASAVDPRSHSASANARARPSASACSARSFSLSRSSRV